MSLKNDVNDPVVVANSNAVSDSDFGCVGTETMTDSRGAARHFVELKIRGETVYFEQSTGKLLMEPHVMVKLFSQGTPSLSTSSEKPAEQADDSSNEPPTDPPANIHIKEAPPKPKPRRFRMDFNSARRILLDAFQAEGLCKVSLKEDEIVLHFITPEKGEQHRAKIQQLSERVGYDLRINPNPNTAKIGELVASICLQYNVPLRKHPSLFYEEKRIGIKPKSPLLASLLQQISVDIQAKTAWQMASI